MSFRENREGLQEVGDDERSGSKRYLPDVRRDEVRW